MSGSYADWIRAQMRGPSDPEVDRALDEAAAAEVETFKGFVEAFLSAYEARRPDVPAARVFTDRDLTTEALIIYLQRRYIEIAAEALLPRLRLVISNISTLSSGNEAIDAAVGRAYARTSCASGAVLELDDAVASLRTTTPARPQGP